jgi:hypothetical protein
MGIEEWWPKLDPSTREWLITHNGEALPPEIIGEIRRAGGSVPAVESSIGANGRSGFVFADDVVDWIDAVANDELPDTT